MSFDRIILPAACDEAEVRRYMGYPRGRRPAGRLAARWPELIRRARGEVAAVGCYRLVDAARLAAAGMPRPSARVAVALVTIGPGLERVAQACLDEGDRAAAMVLDACGSAAVEAAAEALSQQIRGVCVDERLCAQRRVSPGYGRWDVRGQGALLALLPAAALGVSLTAGMMMVPRKSISFAMRLAPLDEAVLHEPGACRSCDMRRCPYARPDEARERTVTCDPS